MATQPTNKPIGSEDPRDLKFNAGKVDEWATSTESEYTDRKGVKRLTADGMQKNFNSDQSDREQAFNNFLLSSGYQFLGDYELGPWQFSERNQYIRYDGQYWKLAKNAPQDFATTGITMATFEVDKLSLVLMDGDSLRQELWAGRGSLVGVGGGDTLEDWIGRVGSAVTPDWFNGSDTEKLKQWMQYGGNLYLDRDYYLGEQIDIMLSDSVIGGNGSIVTDLKVSSSSNIIIVRGDNNRINRLEIKHLGDMRDCGRLLLLQGNNNNVRAFTEFKEDYNPSVEGEQYLGSAVAVDGDHNIVMGGAFKNGGTGVEENGRGNFIERNDVLNCCRGIINGNRSRDAQVGFNTIDLKHKGFPLQSCDGIWGSRSHRGTRYYNNTISNAGEHGAYLQGDSFVWETSNVVNGSQKCLIKIGAKDSGNYQYDDEVLPLFNAYGMPDPDGVYATTGAYASPRGSGNNISNSSDGVVCLQPNIASLLLDNVILEDNPSTNAIRSLHFSTSTGVQVMGKITIEGGDTLRSGNVVLSGYDVKAATFVTDGDIVLSAQYAPVKNIPANLTGCHGKLVRFNSGFDGLNINGGQYGSVNEDSGLNIKMHDVIITNQELGGNFANGRVVKLVDCEITFNTDAAFNINGVSHSHNTTYRFPDCTQSYALRYNIGIGVKGSRFVNNTVIATQTSRPFRFNGNGSICSGNTLLGNGVSDYALTITGDNVTAIGNVHDGNLRLESTATNCLVISKQVSNGNSGGGNRII